MKATGVVRKVDSLGRIVIPKELRNLFSIEHNVPMEIFLDQENIVLKKYQPGCQECGEISNLVEGDNTILCRHCLQLMMNRTTNPEIIKTSV